MHAFGALHPMADADVAEHVVRQRSQQPHRIDRVGELAAERREIAVRFRHQRKEIILILVVAAARADVDAGAVAVDRAGCLVQGVAPRRESRGVDRAIRRVEPDEIGAADELVQLAVVDQRARIEVRDFAGGRAGPARRVPLPDAARWRGARRAQPRGFRPGSLPAAQTAPMPVTRTRGFAIASVPAVDFGRVAQHDAAVRAAEAERVRHRHADRLASR